MFQRVTVALILLSWPYYIAAAVFAKDLLGLFGDEFVQGTSALIVLAAAMALRNTMGALQTVLIMTGRSMWQLANKGAQVSVLIAGSLILVPLLGIVGAAVAYALSVLVDTTLATVQVTTRLGVQSDMRSILSAAAFPVVGVLCTGLALVWLLADAPAYVRLILLGCILVVYVGATGMFLRGRSDFFERPALT
jgi:O-antigen/teichoic acid export membrane protein